MVKIIDRRTDKEKIVGDLDNLERVLKEELEKEKLQECYETFQKRVIPPSIKVLLKDGETGTKLVKDAFDKYNIPMHVFYTAARDGRHLHISVYDRNLDETAQRIAKRYEKELGKKVDLVLE